MQDNNSYIISLRNLMDYNARKFTGAEVQLKNVLPKWIDQAGSIKLKTVMQKYLDLILVHLQKMNDFFAEEKINSLSITSPVMQALLEETNEQLGKCSHPEVKDACLLACIQTINHFKISIYGTFAAFADTLDMSKPALVFREAEINEKQIDDRLSQLAEHEINLNARTQTFLSD